MCQAKKGGGAKNGSVYSLFGSKFALFCGAPELGVYASKYFGGRRPTSFIRAQHP